MSVVFLDSCKGGTVAEKWTVLVTGAYATATPRTTGASYLTGSNRALFSNGQEASFVLHLGVLLGTAADTDILRMENSPASAVASLRVLSTGAVSWWRGQYSTQVVASSPSLVAWNAWNHLQIKVTLATGATGSVQIKLNGTTVVNSTSIQTANSVAGANQWLVERTAADFVVLNSTASLNDFLGDVVVEGLFPTGAGSTTNFTPSAGSNYQNVDDTPANGDTDYNSSSTVGNKDLFAMADSSRSSGTVYAVAVNHRSRKDDAGTREDRGILKQNAVTANGTTRGLSTSYASYVDVFETAPDGSAWDLTKLNAAEAGYEVVT